MENAVEVYQSGLRKEFQLQRECQQFTDLKIVCANGTTHGHKALLFRANEFWKLLLLTEEDTSTVVIMPDETLETVSLWLDTLYDNKFSKTQPVAKLQFEKRCDQCPKVLSNYKSYLSHKWSHQPEKWRIKCKECKVDPSPTFPTKRHLMIHQSKTHGKQLKCHHCPKSFSTDANLGEHIKNVHSSQKFFCEQCGKTFSAKSYLKAHQKKHNEERSFKKCTICDKVVTSRHFSQHLKSHDISTWKYDCKATDCQEKFMTLYKLYEHESVIHTGEPRFKCDNCDQKFLTTAKRANHKKTCLHKSVTLTNLH